MNSKKISSLLLLIFGEVLLIFSFIYFGKNLKTEILFLNIIVSTIIYMLNSIDLLIPWVSFEDKSHKSIGSIGLRWVSTFSYSLLAIGAMIFFNIGEPLHQTTQILFQAILLCLLLFGLFSAKSASNKVRDVFNQEKSYQDRIYEIKNFSNEIQSKMERIENMPSEINLRMNELVENIKYISPSNNIMAKDLESRLINQMKMVNDCISDNPFDFDKLKENIRSCQRLCNERKQIFSN